MKRVYRAAKFAKIASNKGKVKGKEFRGGKKKDRDKWYGHTDKNFKKWWERTGKKEWGIGDIPNKKLADEAYNEWVDRGKPSAGFNKRR
ncbi:hypothetical protein [Lysinibacillus sp. NPDC092081]|uniref:hypothetical protein n=1 Tax=Lysinibacillus sp. NPDC092081 TaxID=3364131 RepID=UPI00382A87A2